MFNSQDEMYEVSDFDEDIQLREALIEEVKNIPITAQWNDVFKEITDLKRRWKRISYWDSAYEDTLRETFDTYIDAFYKKREAGYQSNQAMKQELIQKAVELSKSTQWNTASEELNELMAQWKAIGTSGKELDDALWERFNEARQTFFNRKHEHWETMQVKFKDATNIKQEIILQAAQLANGEDFAKTSEQFRELMEQWTLAGSAGRDKEDNLWNEFQTHRQKFYDRRNAYYEELHGKQEQRSEEKSRLIAQAKAITASETYTKEQTAQMKELSVQWKNIGSCGKDREDALWTEFRKLNDAYFQGLKQHNEQKHAQWRQKMLDARNRKQELIAKQRRQIRYMKDEIVGLLGQRAIDEMEEDIADKEEFIKELEEQLADIDKTLAN